ncbi:MAG: GldJ [Cryomorphaceae bacterium BACL11 MAG-121128-bin16]|nr:MAG: GldJ [Cryomorphaceae bacterium BACL11 MAG-121128-bin16]
MKKIIVLSSVVALLSACGGSGNGELIGVQNRPIWNPTDPYGMVFIPQGSYNMGPSDQDVPFANVSQSKTVSVGAFYMDETEITNNEYRQFTNWVRDSILRQYLVGEYPEEYGTAIVNYADGMETGDYRIDWTKKIRWDDEKVRTILEEEMFLPENERLDGQREFDTREYVYKYQVLDIESAAVKANREGTATGKRDRSKFLLEVEVNIFPDTLTWTHDYSYSFNDPTTKNYFWHPAFDDYPIVGINWKQATAFAHWRTKMMNSFLRAIKQPTLPDFRLPTESEWEYASRGGLDASPYPWGGPYTRNLQGCFLANFKPLRGNYVADGGLEAIKTASYNPNGYGLYDMAGNVAEWTSNAYDESAYSYSHDMNSDYHFNAKDDDNEVLKRKSIRGGSWKDIAYFIQTSTRSFEYQDTAKSYIGFRCAVDFLGRDKKDFE